MSARALGPGELPRLTRVSTDTLRHYERIGLLPAAKRTPGGYRRYPPGAADRVLLIQRALVVGFSLRDLVRVLAERDKGGAPCRSVRAMVGDRLGELDREIEELVTLRAELGALLEEWDRRLADTPAGRPARLLDSLGRLPAIEKARESRRGRPARR